MAHRFLSWESKIFAKFKAKPAYAVIFVGLIIFLFGAVNYYKVRILSFNKVPAGSSTENSDIPVEVIIPSLKIDLPIDPGNIKNGAWQISADNATYLTVSSPPGIGGNTVIYGHNKQKIFGSLPFLSVGQKVTVKTKSGKIYNYIVERKYFVSPDRVDLVSPTDSPILTLYTCWGLFDSQRAVVVAKPL